MKFNKIQHTDILLSMNFLLSDNLFMLSNQNKSTNTLAGSYYVDLKNGRKPISFKYAYHGKKSWVRFDAVKPNQKYTFCLQYVRFSISVADLFVFGGTNLENPIPKSGTKILMWVYSSLRHSSI